MFILIVDSMGVGCIRMLAGVFWDRQFCVRIGERYAVLSHPYVLMDASSWQRIHLLEGLHPQIGRHSMLSIHLMNAREMQLSLAESTYPTLLEQLLPQVLASRTTENS
jgi:hypothetical protein